MQLPSSCEGCPFYQYRFSEGNGYVPDVVVPSSEVYILAQNPGTNEIEGKWLIERQYHSSGKYSDAFKTVTPQPLIGATGQMFNNKFLPLSGLLRSAVSLGNAIRCRPGLALGLKADELPVITATMKLETSKADIVKALKHCRTAHMHVPESTKVVMTMGRYAMFIMTGLAKDEDEYNKKQSVLESWRGYGVTAPYRDFNRVGIVIPDSYDPLDSGKTIFMTMHIAALNYDKKWTHAVMQDFYKLGRLLRGEWPLPLPTWSSWPPARWPHYSAFDTEYDPSDNNRLNRWSLCDTEGHLYCVEAYDTGEIPIEPGSVVLIQNALADIRHLKGIVDIKSVRIEDLMLAHSVLCTGEPHSLNYINSIYGELNRYKHLSKGDPQLYSAMDTWEPMQMWRGSFIPMFRADKKSWNVYRHYRIPLIDIIDKAQQSGARLDSARLLDLQMILKQRLEGYQKRAREITGNDNFNLGGSKALKGEIYGYSDI